MQPAHNKVVVHFNDGRLLKGYTHDFFPEKATFHVNRSQGTETEKTDEIKVADCKAIFFVRTPEGDVSYAEKKKFEDVAAKAQSGIKIKVVFKDGEVIRGISLGYNRARKGFFVLPVDPKSNNERIYIVAASAGKVTIGPDAEK
jgi:hypothetical protein